MTRLILLPGIAADERMFRSLGDLGLPLLTPRLLIPEEGENMSAYANRTAETLGIGPNDTIGGSSFGAMVAAEISRQHPTRALILIGGALSSETLSPAARLLCTLDPLVPFPLLRRLLSSHAAMRLIFGDAGAEMFRLARQMLLETPPERLLRCGKLAASYDPDQAPLCPVHAIHGARDRLMKPPKVPNATILPQAGHGIVVTHAEEVTAFLRKIISTP